MKVQTQAISKALKNYFGYDSFRPLQQEVIQHVLQKNDGLLLMPTGGGKSICYQIPSIVSEGLSIVISPLISLMRDQVEALKRNGVKAAALNSAMTYEEENELREAMQKGEVQILYTSPERFVGENFQRFLHRSKVNLFAVDEAHCISAWGHQFRPEYRQLSNIKTNFPEVPILALTATADVATRKDILKQLNIESAQTFISSFDRSNIAINVLPGRKRYEQILELVKERPNESGIIYCLSRASTEKVATKLQKDGFEAGFYHAGMSNSERDRIQNAFLFDKLKIVCATVAFGMGIDKSNVRYVMHYNLPKNIEGYYQEIGRAGRDGLPSSAFLFFSYADVNILKEFANNEGDGKIQSMKLERMVQFGQSRTCRREMILNYFNESRQLDCDNCDNCQSPPTYFDGTIEAQKILSTMVRMKERGSVEAVADVIRGANTQLIRKMNWDQLKTYGIGNSIPKKVWLNLIEQLLHQGFVRIAYENYNNLKLMPKAKQVLFEGLKVRCYKPEFGFTKAAPVKKLTKKERLKQGLEDLLRAYRSLKSQEEGVPAYVIFSDATLAELAENKPVSLKQLATISGIGDKKLAKYGKEITEQIIDFKIVEKDRSHTQLVTWQMLEKKYEPENIAAERKLTITTVYGHFAKLHEMGFEIDLRSYIDEGSLKMVQEALGKLDVKKTENLSKSVFEYFQGGLPYHIIRLGLILLVPTED